MANQAKDGDTVIIKKYANRRLYNTRTSSYITLDHLAQMVKENVEFKVIDAKSGADLTHSILTQIIMEEEATGEQMLPTNFLRQLIAMYGNSMQALLPGYLEASMEHFRENQNKLRKAIEDSIGSNPLAQIAQRNMEMFKAAAAAFVPGATVSGSTGREDDKPASSSPAGSDSELSELRKQMAEMQKKLEQLGK
ncbi:MULTISPECIES: polyhydroxyalkanoate synthesis repressor PhaR [unclassified Novosphingobium]|uniref:polyhydroxyalkanoate synthesis repressor PhaR n=1 Tax=Novosphingobium TaxID=165696 RepID=UPI001444F322|nr:MULTISPECIES: polyhydroxyalkanoate synthesis repressor PhaR [unclassified Novosphingobium]NKJ41711.1 polyhydroxyalkanoate synthesis repressor PhaR [Novosphingobium sp. SG720]NMN04097.1 polyhydroxyalkanoate synthesis repressor PhaR [Novosphingobium sp. SG919]NMN85913.1 polyhydroxyalkanoate synthesis repressor PhaR [Novosphingobium sp. SG916]